MGGSTGRLHTLYALQRSRNLSRSCCMATGSQRAWVKFNEKSLQLWRRCMRYWQVGCDLRSCLLCVLRLDHLIADNTLFVFAESGKALLQAKVFADDDGCAAAAIAAAIFDDRL